MAGTAENCKREGFVKEIEARILSGRLKPGERLEAERELAAHFGLSRSSVNLGMLELERKGFVRIVPRRGAFVSDFLREATPQTLSVIMEYGSSQMSESLLHDLMDMRALIECECARLACESGRGPSDELLPQLRKVGQDLAQVALLPEVVARPDADHARDIPDRGDERLRVERHVLHLADDEPHDAADRDKEAENGLAQQQPRRRTAAPATVFGEADHLPAQQDVDRRGAQQAAQKGNQLDEDRHPHAENEGDERIAPVSFTDRSHTPPAAQGACRNGCRTT